MTTRRIFADFRFDGKAALEALAATSEYGTLLQAAASLTLFSDPEAVRETAGMNLFPVIRGSQKGEHRIASNGQPVMLDDNQTPAAVFIWANRLWDPIACDAQFNHLIQSAKDVRLYTSLANICVTPAFLSRATDSKTCREIQQVLRYRARMLYGECCVCASTEEPPGYRALEWAPARNYEPGTIEKQFRDAMKTRPRLRATRAAREIGWYFSGFQPDPTV
jgi:hypothetical protein